MSETHKEAADAGRTVRVWDVPVRVFHWVLAALILTSWVTSEIGGNAMTYHMWSGYAILTLVAFRIIWGFIGSEHARFGAILHGPRAMIGYASGLFGSSSRYYLGHNPLGGVSVILMLASVLLQASTGLFATDDIATEGPLTHLVSSATSSLATTIHRWNFWILTALIAIHVAAALFYLIVKRENLIGSMFTGRKRVPAEGDFADGRMMSTWVAVAVVVVVAGGVAALVNWR
jgi:cytochrome b